MEFTPQIQNQTIKLAELEINNNIISKKNQYKKLKKNYKIKLSRLIELEKKNKILFNQHKNQNHIQFEKIRLAELDINMGIDRNKPKKRDLFINININKNKSTNKNINIISKLKLLLLSIDSRILPLFRRHIISSKLEEIQITEPNKGSLINSYTENSLLINRKNLNKLITNQILKIFLKGLIKYNLNLKSYLLQTNKLNFIINIKKDNLYILKTNIPIFIKHVNSLITRVEDNILIFKQKTKKKYKRFYWENFKCLFNKQKILNYYLFRERLKTGDTLFFNKLNLKLWKQFKINIPNTSKYVSSYEIIRLLVKKVNSKNKKLKFKHTITAEQFKRDQHKIQELIKLGNEIITDLDYKILITKNIIYSLKTNNKVLNYLNYILSLYFDSHKGSATTSQFKFYNPNNIGLKYKNYKNNNLVDNFTNTKTNTNTNTNTKTKTKIKIKTKTKTKTNIHTITNIHTNMVKFYKNLFLTKILKLNLVNKCNLIQIEHTIKSIIKNKNFDYQTNSISIKSNPISVLYYKNKNWITDSNSSDFTTPILNKYLQVMSKYNMTNKKIYIYYSNIIGFNFINDNNKLFKNIYNLLAYSFKSMYCLISKPVFVVTQNKIIIHLFYYLFIPNILKAKKIFNIVKNNRNKNLRFYLIWQKRQRKIKRLYSKIRKFQLTTRIKLRKLYLYNITKIFPNKFQKLCEILSNLFKKSIEFNLIRLHYPYNDSNILANLLAIFINRIKLRIIAKKLFGKAVIKNKTKNKISSNNINKLNVIPAFLSGINIKVAGRLLNNKIVPRKTVKTVRRGAVSKGKINYLDVARYTNKNKRGAYSITVSSGQKFF